MQIRNILLSVATGNLQKFSLSLKRDCGNSRLRWQELWRLYLCFELIISLLSVNISLYDFNNSSYSAHLVFLHEYLTGWRMSYGKLLINVKLLSQQWIPRSCQNSSWRGGWIGDFIVINWAHQLTIHLKPVGVVSRSCLITSSADRKYSKVMFINHSPPVNLFAGSFPLNLAVPHCHHLFALC